MTLYLGDKKINAILYPSIKGTKQDKQSWTDGTQTSVTPAGFQDCGFRYYGYYSDKNNIIFYIKYYVEKTTTTEMYFNAIVNTPVYYGIDIAARELTTYDKIITAFPSFKNILFLQSRTLVPKEDTAGLSPNTAYQIKFKTTIGLSNIDLSVLPEEERATMIGHNGFDLCNYFFVMLACVDYDDNNAVEAIRPIYNQFLSGATPSYGLPDYIWNYNNNYVTNSVYVKPGSTAIELVILNKAWSILNSSGLNIDCFILPTSEETSNTVAAAKTDYNAITTELTARGNTITSLNAQGQNLVTKHNTLVDKYNNIISQWGTNKE